jgi:site-specific recombinase XerD
MGDILGSREITSIKNHEVQSIISKLIEEGKSSKYIKDIVSTIQSVFSVAKENGVIKSNPASMIYVPNNPSGKQYRILESEEEKIFLEHAKGKWEYEVLYVMLNTGLRIGEVGGLNIDDVDFKKKIIRVNRQLSCQYQNGIKTMLMTSTKTSNSVREIPFIGDDMEDVLHRQIEKVQNRKKELGSRWRDEGKEEFSNLLFVTNFGSPMIRYNVEKYINKIINSMNQEEAIQAKLENREPEFHEKCYPHALRHTFCSKCFKAGVNPKVVQMLMGHQSYSTTIDIYTHIMKDDLDEEMRKLKLFEMNKISNQTNYQAEQNNASFWDEKIFGIR